MKCTYLYFYYIMIYNPSHSKKQNIYFPIPTTCFSSSISRFSFQGTIYHFLLSKPPGTLPFIYLVSLFSFFSHTTVRVISSNFKSTILVQNHPVSFYLTQSQILKWSKFLYDQSPCQLVTSVSVTSQLFGPLQSP